MDDRGGRRGRRRSWYGLKRHAKRLAAMRIPHLAVRGLARLRPSLRAGGRLPAPARLSEVEGRASGAGYVMLSPDRCIIAKELYWGEGERPAAADQLAIEIFAAAAGRSDVAVDVGAYTGLFTLVAARANPDLHVHAFELIPDNYRALFDNCVRNDLLDRVTLHHAGVGAPGGGVRVPARTAGSALPDYLSADPSAQAGVRVPMVALDALAERIEVGSRVALKIDVEGGEAEVLRHGRRFLEAFEPSILCEVLPGGPGEELERVLGPLGYRFHLVRERDLVPAASIEPDERFRDWLFLPPSGPGADELGAALAGPGEATPAFSR